MIAYQQGLFHRSGWNFIILEEEDVDERNCHYGKDKRINPLYHGAVLLVFFLPGGSSLLSLKTYISKMMGNPSNSQKLPTQITQRVYRKAAIPNLRYLFFNKLHLKCI